MNQINYAERFADAVRNARNRLHLSQSEVAERVAISIHTLSDIEGAKANPSLAVIGPLIEELKINPADIFNQEKVSYDSAFYSAHQFINTCSIDEIEFILPIALKTQEMLRSNSGKDLSESARDRRTKSAQK